jgi:hypothetical protein
MIVMECRCPRLKLELSAPSLTAKAIMSAAVTMLGPFGLAGGWVTSQLIAVKPTSQESLPLLVMKTDPPLLRR